MVLVDSCCCGCTLAQGTVGAGLFSLLRTAVMLVVGIVYLKSSEEAHAAQEMLGYAADDVIYSFHSPAQLRAYGWAFLVESVLVFLMSVSLLLGVGGKNEALLLPWLAYHTVSIIVLVPSILFRVVIGAETHVTSFLLKVSFSVLVVYLYIVVFSYYKMLKALKSGQTLPRRRDMYDQVGYVIRPPPSGSSSTVVDAKNVPQHFVHLPPPPQTYVVPPKNPVLYPPPYSAPPPYSDVV